MEETPYHQAAAFGSGGLDPAVIVKAVSKTSNCVVQTVCLIVLSVNKDFLYS